LRIFEIDEIGIRLVDGDPAHRLVDRSHFEAGDRDQTENSDEASDDGPLALDENSEILAQRRFL
jgi:hypothetical protein